MVTAKNKNWKKEEDNLFKIENFHIKRKIVYLRRELSTIKHQNN